jgi:hypothetical protein
LRERRQRGKSSAFSGNAVFSGVHTILSHHDRETSNQTPPNFLPRPSPTATKPRPSPTIIRSSRQHLVSSPDIHTKQHQRRNKPRDRAQPRRRKVRRVNIQRRIQHSQPQKGAERGVQRSCVNNPVSIFSLSPHTTTRKPQRRTQENRIKLTALQPRNIPCQHSPDKQRRVLEPIRMRRLGALKPRVHVRGDGFFACGQEVDAARGRVVPEVVVCALYCCDLGEGGLVGWG